MEKSPRAKARRQRIHERLIRSEPRRCCLAFEPGECRPARADNKKSASPSSRKEPKGKNVCRDPLVCVAPSLRPVDHPPTPKGGATIKFDGYRCNCAWWAAKGGLRPANGLDWTTKFLPRRGKGSFLPTCSGRREIVALESPSWLTEFYQPCSCDLRRQTDKLIFFACRLLFATEWIFARLPLASESTLNYAGMSRPGPAFDPLSSAFVSGGERFCSGASSCRSKASSRKN